MKSETEDKKSHVISPTFGMVAVTRKPSIDWNDITEDPDFKEHMRIVLENYLVTSDLQVLQRLTDIEKVMGLNGWEDTESEEKTVPTILRAILKRLSRLERQINADAVLGV